MGRRGRDERGEREVMRRRSDVARRGEVSAGRCHEMRCPESGEGARPSSVRLHLGWYAKTGRWPMRACRRCDVCRCVRPLMAGNELQGGLRYLLLFSPTPALSAIAPFGAIRCSLTVFAISCRSAVMSASTNHELADNGSAHAPPWTRPGMSGMREGGREG